MEKKKSLELEPKIARNFISIEAYDAESKTLNVIIDTPKGSRNKFKYDEKLGLFKLGGVLPLGAFFPYDFGYIPSTLGGDGDPLDVLILMDEPAFVGCLVPAKLIGVIEAEQTEDRKTERNDRLIAVAADSRNHVDLKSIKDLNKNLVHEVEHFFISYNQSKGKIFKPLGRFGPSRAERIVAEGRRAFKESRK
jgi:inorganic pyrophosphatase